MDGKYVDIGFSGAALIVLLAFVVCFLTYYFLRTRVKRKVLLGVMLLFLVGFAIRLFILLKNPYMYGIDGPWYVFQVGYFLEHGHFGAFVAPLVLHFTTGLSVFVGDATLGVKIAQAFLSALPILTTWLLVRYLTKNNFVSFAAALLVGLSAMTIGMSDVLRNTGALAFVPLFYLFFLKFVRGEGRGWTLKTLKIRGREFGLTLNTSLLLSLIFYLVILGCHFLTAGFVLMTVVAYIAFFIGYHRRLPRPELKFIVILLVLMLLAGLAYPSLRKKVFSTANGMARSEPVPAGLFPFSETEIPSPGGDGGGAQIFIFFLPFILLALPAMWFTLRHKDRRYLLFTATVPLCLLCSQNWIVNYMFSFRFMIMMYIALLILVGISIWYIRKRLKKVGAIIFVCAIGFSLITLAGMGAEARPWIGEGEWTELKEISGQLPENSTIMTPGSDELFYWGQLIFGRELGATLEPWGPPDVKYLADEMERRQEEGKVYLAVATKDYIGDENLENLGLEIFDNVQTEHYCVLKLAENSGGKQPNHALATAQGEGPGGLPVYEDATRLDLSPTELQELVFGEHTPPPGVSMEAYTTLKSPSVVGSWYGAQMSELGWTLEENMTGEHHVFLRYSRAGRGAMINAYENQGVNTILTLAEWGEGGPGEEPPGGPGFGEPEATSEIRFNHNPLFAFILLPIELVQGLYGTTVYGALKLLVAIPLSVGLVGFLMGLVSILIRKLKKVRLSGH